MATSPNQFLEFLLKITYDPALQRAFEADPTEVMDEAGLSPDEQTIIRTRDLEALHAAFMRWTPFHFPGNIGGNVQIPFPDLPTTDG